MLKFNETEEKLKKLKPDMIEQMERANEFEAKSMMKDTTIQELERSLKVY